MAGSEIRVFLRPPGYGCRSAWEALHVTNDNDKFFEKVNEGSFFYDPNAKSFQLTGFQWRDAPALIIEQTVPPTFQQTATNGATHVPPTFCNFLLPITMLCMCVVRVR